MKKIVTILSLILLCLSAGINKSYAISIESSNSNISVSAPVLESKSTSINLAKGGEEPINKILYVVLAIFGLGWIGIGVNTGFSGSKWIIALLLTFLFWLPGVIYTLVQMKNFY